MRLSYFPGCTLKSHARNCDDSTFAAMACLGMEIKELDRWNCCGTVHGLASDDLIHRLAPITNLIRVKEEGANTFTTSCAMCYNTLKRANRQVREDQAALAVINDFLSLENTKYAGDVEVVHLLEILRDQIGFEKLAKQVKKPLKGLRVACYYGCLLVRPKEIAIDNLENPQIMDHLITALGATAIPFSLRTECCGAYHTVAQPEIIAGRTNRIITAAAEQGADMIAVSCPLCAHNLDHRQADAKNLAPGFHHLPVLYFTQLMAIALGCESSVLRFDLNYIDPQPALMRFGLN